MNENTTITSNQNGADSEERPSSTEITDTQTQGVSHAECTAERYDLSKGERWVLFIFIISEKYWTFIHLVGIVKRIHLFWKPCKNLKVWALWNAVELLTIKLANITRNSWTTHSISGRIHDGTFFFSNFIEVFYSLGDHVKRHLLSISYIIYPLIYFPAKCVYLESIAVLSFFREPSPALKLVLGVLTGPNILYPSLKK